MKFKVIYNPEVYNDLQEAIDYYNEQQPGLGKRFFITAKKQLNSLKSTIANICLAFCLSL